MAEHSKTPWRAEGPDDFGDYNILNGDDCLAIAAVVSNMRPAGCVAANAAFIVRAANCHAELIALAEQFEQTIKYYAAKDKRSGDDEGARMKLATMHSVRETIAKSRGETP